RSTAGSNKATREFFYQDTNSSHAYVVSKNKHLRKTLDKKQAGTVICSSEYDLDAAGNRLGRTDQDGKYDSWSYDPNQQLRAESRWSAKTPGTLSYRTEYGYDGNGNRTVMFEDGVKVAYTIGNNNEMTEAGADDITYDFYGNTYYINDGVTGTEFLYDYQRHLTEVFQNESQIAEFEYDGNGRRMRAEYNQSGVWTNIVHCELTGEILAEYTLVSTTFTIKCLNTYGIGLVSSNRESTKRYFHFDGLGSTVALTDASENITDTYVYSAFGNLLSSTGSSVNPYRFLAQGLCYDDSAMGMVFSMILTTSGYYVPKYGRFITLQSSRTGTCDDIFFSIDAKTRDVIRKCQMSAKNPTEFYECVKKNLGGAALDTFWEWVACMFGSETWEPGGLPGRRNPCAAPVDCVACCGGNRKACQYRCLVEKSGSALATCLESCRQREPACMERCNDEQEEDPWS
nr:hypothetical protein [Fimbriimonadaceae bacterium]